MVGVRFDAVEEIIVGGVKQISDGRQIVTAVAESLAATHHRVQTSAVGSRGHSRPCWRGILNPGDDNGVEYVVERWSNRSRVVVVTTVFISQRSPSFLSCRQAS